MAGDPQVTSARSARVTEVRKLHDRRHRARRGAFVVEGPHAVSAAIVAGMAREVYAVADAAPGTPVDAAVAAARGAGIPVRPVAEAALAAMSETRHPQGVLATCDLVTVPLDRAVSAGMQRLVVLDRVSDPGNAGTIIRTADAAGADAVILTAGSVDPHNGKCVRASAGSLFTVPVCADADPVATLAAIRAAGLVIVAADAGGDLRLGTPEATELLAGPIAWVFGTEAHGVDPRLLADADAVVSIPMRGGAESLNLAVAAGICLYA